MELTIMKVGVHPKFNHNGFFFMVCCGCSTTWAQISFIQFQVLDKF